MNREVIHYFLKSFNKNLFLGLTILALIFASYQAIYGDLLKKGPNNSFAQESIEFMQIDYIGSNTGSNDNYWDASSSDIAVSSVSTSDWYNEPSSSAGYYSNNSYPSIEPMQIDYIGSNTGSSDNLWDPTISDISVSAYPSTDWYNTPQTVTDLSVSSYPSTDWYNPTAENTAINPNCGCITSNGGYPAQPPMIYQNPAPIVYQNPAPIITSTPVYPQSGGNSYAPYYYNAPTTYTYTDNTKVDSHNRWSSTSSTRINDNDSTRINDYSGQYAYQYADIGSFNTDRSYNDSHEGQFAQSGFNTSDSHDVSLSQGGGTGGGTQSVRYNQTTSSPAFRGISYAQTGSGINTSGIEYRQFPLSGSTNTSNYRISQAASGNSGSGSTGTTSNCPSGTISSQDDQGNIICTQNKVISQVQQPKVVYTAGDVVSELPKTGLPLAAVLLSGFLPLGIKLRRLNKQTVEKSANTIWEERQLSK